jgi:hypothetical protein
MTADRLFSRRNWRRRIAPRTTPLRARELLMCGLPEAAFRLLPTPCAQILARYRPLPEIPSRTFQEEVVWRNVYALWSEIKRMRATVLRAHPAMESQSAQSQTHRTLRQRPASDRLGLNTQPVYPVSGRSASRLETACRDSGTKCDSPPVSVIFVSPSAPAPSIINRRAVRMTTITM